MVLIKNDEEEKVQIQDQIQAQPCENIEVFNVPEKEVIFEVKQSANGMGMFALKDIPPGQIILREKPLIVMPDKVFSSEDSDYIEAWLDKRLNKMSSEDRQKFYDLSDFRSEKTTLGIFFTNDMNFVDDSAALFPTVARVNHACRPNADFITRKFLGVQDLVATKFIAQGNTFIFQVLIFLCSIRKSLNFQAKKSTFPTYQPSLKVPKSAKSDKTTQKNGMGSVANALSVFYPPNHPNSFARSAKRSAIYTPKAWKI